MSSAPQKDFKELVMSLVKLFTEVYRKGFLMRDSSMILDTLNRNLSKYYGCHHDRSNTLDVHQRLEDLWRHQRDNKEIETLGIPED